MSVNWNTVKKVSGGIAIVAALGIVLDYITAKTRYYRKAAETMTKTNKCLDKTGKLIENTLE